MRWIGKDGNGIRRVYGDGPSREIAESRCMDAATEYVKRRRDTGPLSMWEFVRETLTLDELDA